MSFVVMKDEKYNKKALVDSYQTSGHTMVSSRRHKTLNRSVDLKTSPKCQGWISDMGIDGPTFVPKSGYFLLIWVKVCPQKLAFSQFFSQFNELAFLTKCWLFQTRNPTLSLFLAFFGCCNFTVLFKYYLKSCFLTKTAH